MAIDTTFALISLDDAKTQLKITASSENTILGDIINGVSALVNSYCKRVFLTTSFTEYYDGNGQRELILRNVPIISISTLYNADANRTFDSSTEVDVSADVLIKKQSGIIELWNNEAAFIKGSANIKITYVAGYALASIPFDIQMAVRLMVAQKYMKYSTREYNHQSQTIGDMTTTYSNEDIPKEAKVILDHYSHMASAPDFAYAD